jgi:AraC family transcriptional regulator of adaptative response/methylated-DNA-[protein]-cysteine methyltransferase
MQDEHFWQAVIERNARFDGTFVFAVRSTGIYCRPSCPARRPRRENVRFFAQPKAAEQAGFRPCRRCHPQQAIPPEPQAELIARVCRYIEAHLDEPLTLDALSATFNLSPYHLQRTFKRIVGLTPRQYAEAQRLGQFKTQLKEGDTVTTALYEAGYGSSSRLYEQVPERLGMTPATYRRGGQDAHIRYTIAPCALGLLLVAATERGICAVYLGDSEDTLAAELAAEYPAAHIERDGAHLNQWVTIIFDHLNGQPSTLDLPLDVQATAFQWRVWEALRAIPSGSTCTYGEIAHALGVPNAARAVGRACATNPVSVVIPCHRAVGSDGRLHGFRWGLERKQWLLEHERSVAQQPSAENMEVGQNA